MLILVTYKQMQCFPLSTWSASLMSQNWTQVTKCSTSNFNKYQKLISARALLQCGGADSNLDASVQWSLSCEIAACLAKTMHWGRRGTKSDAGCNNNHSFSPNNPHLPRESTLQLASPALTYSTSEESFMWNLTGCSCNGVSFTGWLLSLSRLTSLL